MMARVLGDTWHREEGSLPFAGSSSSEQGIDLADLLIYLRQEKCWKLTEKILPL
jgi:hypothetical protein